MAGAAGRDCEARQGRITAIIKEYLQPIATIIAAFTAAGIIGVFARAQAQTAKNQAKIALDKLRFDLFEKRYGIYETTKNLIRFVLNDRRKPEFRAFDIVPFLVIIDEAIFFFPDDICRTLKGIADGAQRLAELQSAVDHDVSSLTDVQAEILATEKVLTDALRNMPHLFAPALSFPQLTGRM